MPVFGAQAGHENPQEEKKTTEHEDGAEQAIIGGPAGKSADEEEEEDLHGADPGDGRGRLLQCGNVVRLEDPEGVDVAPDVEDDQVAHECLGPCGDAAIGGWAGVDGDVGDGFAEDPG